MYGYETSTAATAHCVRRGIEHGDLHGAGFSRISLCDARARARSSAVSHIIDERYTRRAELRCGTCYWRRGSVGFTGDQSCFFSPPPPIRTHNVRPSLAVNYIGSFLSSSRRARTVSSLKYSTPSAHLRRRCIFMRPITSPSRSPAAPSLFLSREIFCYPDPPMRHHYLAVAPIPGRACCSRPFRGYIYCVIICPYASPFIYGATSSTFPLCRFNEWSWSWG